MATFPSYFLDPRTGIEKKSDPGINIRDPHHCLQCTFAGIHSKTATTLPKYTSFSAFHQLTHTQNLTLMIWASF
jgi:hypothetical protein